MSNYKLMSMEPTPEMISEGARYLQIMSLPEREAASVFRAMSAVAPVVQREPVGYVDPEVLPLLGNGFKCLLMIANPTEQRSMPLYTDPQPAEQPDVAQLVEALEEIVHPIRFMQERLEEGERLNGLAAVQLAGDASYLRDIAIAALAAYRKQGDECDIEPLKVENKALRTTIEELVGALEQIERWDGFPSTDKTWEGSGEPVSYGAAFGSNGERDFMRKVARKALATCRKQGCE